MMPEPRNVTTTLIASPAMTAPVPSPSRANRMISFTAQLSSGPARQRTSRRSVISSEPPIPPVARPSRRPSHRVARSVPLVEFRVVVADPRSLRVLPALDHRRPEGERTSKARAARWSRGVRLSTPPRSAISRASGSARSPLTRDRRSASWPWSVRISSYGGTPGSVSNVATKRSVHRLESRRAPRWWSASGRSGSPAPSPGMPSCWIACSNFRSFGDAASRRRRLRVRRSSGTVRSAAFGRIGDDLDGDSPRLEG